MEASAALPSTKDANVTDFRDVNKDVMNAGGDAKDAKETRDVKDVRNAKDVRCGVRYSTSRHAVSPALQKRGAEATTVPQLDYAVTSIQGKRRTQEDTHTSIPDISTNREETQQQPPPAEITASGPFAFFGVYDGHGGREAAAYLADHLHTLFERDASLSSYEDISGALCRSFLAVEKEFSAICRAENIISGTTAAVCVFKDKQLFIGNVGDTEVVLSRAGKAISLTEVHNPSKNPREAERVQREGGRLWKDRVGHPVLNPQFFSIAVSRAMYVISLSWPCTRFFFDTASTSLHNAKHGLTEAFIMTCKHSPAATELTEAFLFVHRGDFTFKSAQYTHGLPSGMTAEPFVTHLDLTAEDKFIIMACDGLWDVASPQQAVDFVVAQLERAEREGKPLKEVTRALAKWAYDKGSLDNITIQIIKLLW